MSDIIVDRAADGEVVLTANDCDDVDTDRDVNTAEFMALRRRHRTRIVKKAINKGTSGTSHAKGNMSIDRSKLPYCDSTVSDTTISLIERYLGFIPYNLMSVSCYDETGVEPIALRLYPLNSYEYNKHQRLEIENEILDYGETLNVYKETQQSKSEPSGEEQKNEADDNSTLFELPGPYLDFVNDTNNRDKSSRRKAFSEVDSSNFSGLFPFPTLYWLVHPVINTQVAQLEEEGWINKLRIKLIDSERGPEIMTNAHEAYALERWNYLSTDHKNYVAEQGWLGELKDSGVAGMKNFDSVKCLHTHYAHYRSAPHHNNIIGRWVNELLLSARDEEKEQEQS